MTETSKPFFNRVCFIGIGLIGSSLARVMRRDGLTDHICIASRTQETLDKANELGLCDSATTDLALAVKDADLVMICTPLGTFGKVGAAIGPHVKSGAIVSDVGSAKKCVFREIGPHLNDDVHLIPGHPVAGTEHSGPQAGFAEMFMGRHCILTPGVEADKIATHRVTQLWQAAGMTVEIMDPDHHDQVLAITSHLPHLIAYSIVDTATQLGDDLQKEIFRYSASGFRDFTRIAASDPVMWRDIFIENRDAVLEMLNRFDEDLTNLKRAVRKGDGDALQEVFTRTRAARRSIIEAKQHVPEDQKI